MRTKVLCAAALAAGALTSMAQVYSANIVGYYNVTATPGLNLVANQLDAGGNTLNEVLPAAPFGWNVLKYHPELHDYVQDSSDGTQWVDANSGDPSTTKVAPGEGFFVENTDASAKTLTFVGQVRTGTNTVTLEPGLKLVSTPCPEALELTAANGFPQQFGMNYMVFDPTLHDYVQSSNDGTEWVDANSGDPVHPTPAIGQGYFIENVDSGVTYSWTHVYP